MPEAAESKLWYSPGYPNRYASVLVIIPAFNEGSNIAYVIQAVKQAAGFVDILVINDGSDDDTAFIAAQQGAGVLDLPFNLGIGGAVQAGIKYAYRWGYPLMVRVDGDGQHDPFELHKLLGAVMQGKANVAVGSRFLPGAETYRPPLSRMMGICYFSLLVSLLVGQRITDTTSGFQCLDKKAISYFAKYYPQDYPEVEAHIMMKKAGLKVTEVPVHMHPRRSGTSSINYIRAVYYMLKVTLATWIAFIRQEPQPRRSPVSYVEVPHDVP